MPLRHKLMLLLVALLALAAFLWAFRVREPSFQGQILSEWLAGYAPYESAISLRQAQQAILHIGTNGLLFLLEWINYEEPGRLSQLRRSAKFRRAVDNLPIPNALKDRLREDKQSFRAERAADAFATLGRIAEPVIPDLMKALNQGSAKRSARAARALANTGPRALAPLLSVLTNQNTPARRFVAGYIYHLGTNAQPAIPALIACLDDPSPSVADAAIFSLGELRLEPELTIPGLIHCLDPSFSNRADAAAALAKFGPEAAPAVPTLMVAMNDPLAFIRGAAHFALMRIAPEVLTNAPPE